MVHHTPVKPDHHQIAPATSSSYPLLIPPVAPPCGGRTDIKPLAISHIFLRNALKMQEKYFLKEMENQTLQYIMILKNIYLKRMKVSPNFIKKKIRIHKILTLIYMYAHSFVFESKKNVVNKGKELSWS